MGRMPWSSNRTFLVTCTLDGEELPAIYKPGRGERRLWDFPGGLYRREVAAFELSEALGWGVVPETALRADGPLGEGSCQRFVPADFSQHHFTLVEEPRHHERLKTIAAFDVVANNADRKSGHCLLGEDGTIWAIDNGLSFHREPKLRTVIWDFAGESIPPGVCADLHTLLDDLQQRGALHDRLATMLERFELDALRVRTEHLIATGVLPEADRDYHSYPWPTI